MNKFQRQLPGDRGQSSPRKHQLLGQPRLHSALFKLSQAHKSLGTGKNCWQPWEQPLAGGTVGGVVRGLGEREERQTDQRGGKQIRDETDRWKQQEKRAREMVPRREARKHEKDAHTEMDRETHGKEVTGSKEGERISALTFEMLFAGNCYLSDQLAFLRGRHFPSA